MAANVVWLDQARDDISELIDYLFPKNPTATLTYIAELERACDGLAGFGVFNGELSGPRRISGGLCRRISLITHTGIGIFVRKGPSGKRHMTFPLFQPVRVLGIISV